MTIAMHPDTDGLASAMSRAFYDDPLFIHFFPNAAKREQHAYYTFRYMLTHAHNCGDVVATEGGTDGAAVWLPSRAMEYSSLDLIRFGAIRGVLHQGIPALFRQLRALNIMLAMHRSIIIEPHYYLAAVGVDPARQGKGLGSALLRPTLERFDDERMPAYLDTHNERNVSLFQRFGFEILHHGYLPNSSVMHWAMLRLPR